MADERAEALVLAQCLEEFEREGDVALERACVRYPNLAEQLRANAAAVRAVVGALADESPGDPVAQEAPRSRVGRFEICGVLGRGGAGVVYRARDPRLDREVAIKVLPVFATAGAGWQRFRNEARALARLDHANIVQVHDDGTTQDGAPFLVMELVDRAESLATILGRLSRRDPNDLVAADLRPAGAVDVAGSWIDAVVHMMGQLADAVQHAHGCELVHRDVKPGNVLIDAAGNARLVDFGIARLLDDPAEVTRTGTALGTPAYMAPEQVDAHGHVGPWTDVHGLGAVLYACLTLRPPFQGDGREQVLQRVRAEQPRRPRLLAKRTPPDLETICMKTLDKAPVQRYPSAAAMGDDLRRFAEGRPVAARPLGRTRRLWRLANRNRAATAVVVLLLLLAVGGPLWWAILENRTRRRVEDEQRATLRESLRADRATAESLYRGARLAARRGDWAAALADYELARQQGYSDAVNLAIGRIEALEGNLQTKLAVDEIVALRERQDLGTNRGRVLLLDAGLAANRLLQPEHKLDQVREALALGGLTVAEVGFAQALLADRVDIAIAHLRKAHQADPAHRRVNDLYLSLLIAAGRAPDALRLADEIAALYPEDTTALLSRAVLLTMLRRDAEVGRMIDDARARLSRAQLGWLSFAVHAGRVLRSFDSILRDGIVRGEEFGFGDLIRRVGPLLLQEMTLRRSGGYGAELQIRLAKSVTVPLRGMLRETFATALQTHTIDEHAEAFHTALAEASERVGDGVYSFCRGQICFAMRDYTEAAAAFRDAASRPSLIVSPETVWLYVAAAERSRGKGAAGRRDGVREAVAAVLRANPEDAATLAWLCEVALDVGVSPIGLEAALRWRGASPSDRAAAAAIELAIALLRRR